jgi:hypothetical protein
MTTKTGQEEANVGTRTERATQAGPEGDGRHRAPQPATERIWHALEKASFAVVGYVTPTGEPRSSGVVYKTLGRRMYVAVAPDSWKAKHIAANGRVAVTAIVRRGGILSLVMPIPPATISFHASAVVFAADSPEVRPLLKELGSLLPPERQHTASVIEIVPEGAFVTYGVGVPLMKMRDPNVARGRVPVE